MSTTIGQLPHFDVSTPNFTPIGTTYLTGSGPGSTGSKIVILYGSSDGQTRKRLALRRYVYRFIETSVDIRFIFFATYKGVRNRDSLPLYVGDANDVNDRFSVYGEPLPLELEPSYITQNLLKTLFLYPNIDDYFFIDGSHSCRMGPPNLYGPKPNFFEIYRYGKLSKDDITKIISFKNNLLATRSII
jgi:hypothetical protein